MTEQTLFNSRNVFISWNHKDRAVKDCVCSFIRQGGYSVWESDLECAGSITEVCLGNIRFCDVFLILLTEHSLKSEWVRAELEEALKLPDAKRRILPLMIGNDDIKKEAKAFFSDISYIHLLSAADLPDIKKKLLTSVEYLVLDRCFAVYRSAFLHESIRIPLYNGAAYAAMPAYSVKENADFSDLYISRKLYEIAEHQNDGNTIASEEELLESTGNVVIIGESGSGKSQYMKRFAAAAGQNGNYLVFQVGCGTFARSRLGLTEYLYMQFTQKTGSENYTAEQFRTLLKRKEEQTVVLFDGMDEIIEETSRMLQKAVDFSEQYQLSRFIFTTRNRQDADLIASYGIKVKKYELHNFDGEESERFIEKLFAALHEGGREGDFCKALEAVGEQTRSNPLLLGQLILIYCSSGSLPDTEVKIFDLTTEILVKDIDREHDIFDFFVEKERELVKYALPDILKRLAYEKCLDRSANRLSENAEIVAEILCKSYGYQTRSGDALVVAGKVITYLQRRYILSGSEFAHKMWLEYFAASWLYDAAYRRGKLVDEGLLRRYFAEYYQERYWEKITELFLSKADDTFVTADGGTDRKRYQELYDIILLENKGDYGLLFRISRLLKNRSYIYCLLLRDIAVKTVRGKLPAYGQLFCYVPREKLYESLLAVTNELCPAFSEKERLILLSLVRDVCYIYGGFVSSGQVTEDAETISGLASYAAKYGASPRAALNGMFYKAALPWLSGYIEAQKNSRVYPFCFNVYAVSICDGSGFGEYELDETFTDELFLYQETRCGADGRFIGLVSVPYRWEEMRCSFRPGFYQDMTGLILLPSEETVFERSPVMPERLQVLYLPGSIREYRKNALAGLGKDTDGVRISIAYGIVWNKVERIKKAEKYVIRIKNSPFAYNGLKYVGPIDSIFFPATVSEIVEGLCMNNQVITHFPFHGNRLKLGEMAMKSCKGLLTANIPMGITRIGESAFEDCTSLVSVVIPESVTEIGENAFKNCLQLRSITILGDIRKVMDGTFEGCESLQIVRLSHAVNEISKSAFKRCRSLQTILCGEMQYDVFYNESSECPFVKKEPAEDKERAKKRIEREKTESERRILEYLEYMNLKSREGEEVVRLPETVNKIEACQFRGMVDLRTVLIPDSVTEIKKEAFSCCEQLSAIDIPESVKKIGYLAFNRCIELRKVTIPTGVAAIEPKTFRECRKLEEVELPEGIIKIENDSFSGCRSLTYIRLPETVERIGKRAFEHCEKLKEIILQGKVTEIGAGAFLGCGELTNVKLPEGLTEIAEETFCGCSSLTKLVIPETVERIGKRAFEHCEKLKEIILQGKVTEIGAGAFRSCSELTNVKLPEGLTEIAEETFCGCSSLTKLVIPETVERIGKRAFEHCEKLKEIILQGKVTEIGAGAFLGCGELTNVKLPEELTEIADGTFCSCSSLTKLIIPPMVKEIGWNAFSGCSSLEVVVIPQNVKKIGDRAFCGCSELRMAELPRGIVQIGYEAFRSCSNLADMMLPEGIRRIEKGAFSECNSLEDIMIPGTVENLGEEIFADCLKLRNVKVQNGITEIGGAAFRGCISLTDLTLPKTLQTIGRSAFEGCLGLQNIEMPEKMMEIGPRVFADCSSLTEFRLLNDMESVPGYLFSGCVSLQRIRIPENVREIGRGAFHDCISLSEIVLPEHVQEIGGNAFQNCESLLEIAFPESVTEIKEETFSGCSGLVTIDLPEQLSEIGSGAFQGCSSLVSFAIPRKLTVIREETFSDCIALRELYIPAGVNEIMPDAFSGCKLSKITIHKKFQGMLGVLFGNVISCMPHPDEHEMIVAEFETLQ